MRIEYCRMRGECVESLQSYGRYRLLGLKKRSAPDRDARSSGSPAMCSPVLADQSGLMSATIYVGRHFEVRDHDQPTKYVFNGFTRVVGLGIGPTTVGGSYKHSRTSCVTGGDVVMKIGEGMWSVVPRRLRPWTANEDKARELELQTQKLDQQTQEIWAQVHRTQASIDEKSRQIDEKLQYAQQHLDAKLREAQQRRRK